MPYSTSNTLNLGANAKTGNLLSGDINEFVPTRARVNIFAVASAVGTNITVLADSDVAVDDQEILAIGTTLDKSQHLTDSFVVAPGTRLAITLRDISGAATNDIFVGIEVLPF